MISRRTVLALAATVAFTAGTFVWTPAKAGQDILIGGGSVTGVYYQVALNVCNLLNKHAGDKYNCVGRPALGSVFNIRAVKRTLLDFGVAQSDRNFEAFRGICNATCTI